jgi:hypothetical protein
MFSLKFYGDTGSWINSTGNLTGVVQGSDVATGSLVRVGGENVGALSTKELILTEQTMTRRM